jgi:hypothetical protein
MLTTGPHDQHHPPKASVSESVSEKGALANSRDAWTGRSPGRNGHSFAISDSAKIVIMGAGGQVSRVSQAGYEDTVVPTTPKAR